MIQFLYLNGSSIKAGSARALFSDEPPIMACQQSDGSFYIPSLDLRFDSPAHCIEEMFR